MTDLSEEAVEAINRIIADSRTLNSDCVDLYRYIHPKGYGVSPSNTVLNDVYHFLIDNGLVTSNNPTSSTSKFLTTFTSEGRKLHKAGSLKRYFQKGQSLDKVILEYLEPFTEGTNNRSIQQALELTEVECETVLRTLFERGYIIQEHLCDGNYMDCFYSTITSKGRTFLKPKFTCRVLCWDKLLHIQRLTADGNNFVLAGGNVNQSGISLVSEKRHLPKLKELGVEDEDIDILKEIIEKTQHDKSARIVEIMKWLGDVLKKVVLQNGTDALPEFMEHLSNLIK